MINSIFLGLTEVTMEESKSYVYWIKNLTTGYKYIGVKYARNADPNTFWKTYFTSSKHVQFLIEQFGVNDFKTKILKTFDNPYDAILYEKRLLHFAVKRDDYLNLHVGFIGTLTQEEFTAQIQRQKKSASIIGALTYILGIGIHIDDPELKRKYCSMGGYATRDLYRDSKMGFYSNEAHKKGHQILRETQRSAFYDPNLRYEISSKGGKVGCFTKEYYEKNGLGEEDRIEAQRERGRRGGPKNKGFRWYNDGKKSYKYTVKQQSIKSFQDFIIENPQFSPGRNTILTGKKWCNDGINNYFISLDEIQSRNLTLGRLGDKGKYNGHKNRKNSKEQQS